MLAEADEHEWIAAVTAWLPLDEPARARERLDELEQHSSFRAVRHLVHNEPDQHWILRPSVLECLDLLEERGVILEIPVVFPRHLDDVPTLAERFPELPIVIDHLGKPPIARPQMQQWERSLRAAAAPPLVAAKLSGLNTAVAGSDWVADDFIPACEAALECFGPHRLMCGSDWPVLLLNGDYDRVWDAALKLAEVAGRHAAALLGENAARIYRFTDVQSPTTSPARNNEWQHR
jgi:L-fuconolactonase